MLVFSWSFSLNCSICVVESKLLCFLSLDDVFFIYFVVEIYIPTSSVYVFYTLLLKLLFQPEVQDISYILLLKYVFLLLELLFQQLFFW